MKFRVAALAAAALAVPGLFAAAAANSATLTAADTPAPPPPHVLQIVLENHDYEQIIGNTAEAPYLNSLAGSYGLATKWSDLSHPSEPNYLGLMTGSIQDNPQDRMPADGTYPGPSFVDELAGKGIGWKAYMEDMPRPCDLSDTQGPGGYNVVHNPFAYLDSIRNNPAQCGNVVPFDQFGADLRNNTAPSYLWVTPNMQHDMHDGSIRASDDWLRQQLEAVLASPWYAQNGTVVITWDEGEPGDHIPAIVVSDKSKGVPRLTAAGDHNGTLRTLERLYGVGFLGGSASTGADLMPLLGGTAAPAGTAPAGPPPSPAPAPTAAGAPPNPGAAGPADHPKRRRHKHAGTDPSAPPAAPPNPGSTAAPAPAAAAAPPPPPAGPWTLAGSDDFSGSTVDTGKWGLYSGGSGSNKWNPANCVEGGGELKVIGAADGSSCGISWHQDQTYGAWEVHAKFNAPAASQFDTTFIAWPQDDSQWQNAEMDYVEETDPARQQLDGFLHCTACSGGQLEAQTPVDMTQWHTYRLEWTPKAITFLVDGKPRFNTTDPATISTIPHHGTIQTDYNPDGGSPTPTTVEVNSFKVYTYTP